MITYLGRYICEDVDGCHECISHKKRSCGRYYTVKYKGEPILLHRLIFREYKEDLIKGFCIRHTCDNTSCVNPDHLLQGTSKQNSQDMIDRGRTLKGEDVHFSVLTWEDVKYIRENDHKGKWFLSEKFKVNERTIRDILAKRSWWPEPK